MPMGIVNSEEFESQLKDSGIPLVPVIKPKVEIVDTPTPGPGRNEGDVNVPNSLRNLIGSTAIENGRNEGVALAKALGISSSSVSAYSKGATSTDSYNDRPNLKSINSVKERLGKKARHKMSLALNNITEDKMKQTTVRELAGVAKDMAIISKAMEPEPESDDNASKNPVQFVFYAPQVNQENHYNTTVAKDDF